LPKSPSPPLGAAFQTQGLSLFIRVAAFVFVTTATTVTTLTAVSYIAAHWIIRQQVEQRLHLAATQRAQAIEMYVRQQHERARLIASRTRLRRQLEAWNRGELPSDAMRTELSQILRDALGDVQDFDAIALTDVSGRVVAATEENWIGRDRAEELSFQQGHSAPFLGEFQKVDGEYQTVLAAPAQTEDGQLLGVVMVSLRSSSLVSVIANPAGLGSSGEALLGRRNGADQIQYLLPTRRGEELRISTREVPAMVKALQGTRGFEEDVYAGEEVLVAYQPVAYQPGYQEWGLIVKITAAEAFTPLQNLRRIIVPLGLLLLIPAILSAYWLASRYARPIMQLANSAKILATGNLKHRVSTGEQDEIGVLSRAFNEMAEQLEASYDVLERRVAERTDELSRANTELARSNRDLEQFAYVASHDLQEPLRAIAGFTKLLLDSPDVRLEPSKREFLQYIAEGAERMKLLIDNLLEYSRVRTQGAPLQPTSAQQAFDDALANLQVAIAKSGAQVTASGLGEVFADRGQLTQLFQNLIGNAIKFTENRTPQIHVEAVYDHEKATISVRDNGIGIDAKDYNRIFAIFQRLHAREDYEGTGLGLAICQQIVQRHGGQIWVESTPGVGSCFFFTLPLPSQEPPHVPGI
jgi:signal transduction histidine kinase